MKRLFSIFLTIICPLLVTSQVNEYSAKRLTAYDSLRLYQTWIRKITTNLSTSDSNSHNMLPTNRAVMDAIRAYGGGGGGGIPSLPQGRLAFGNAANQLDNSDSLKWDRTFRTLVLNKGASDSPALRILQPSGTGLRPWLEVLPPITNDSTSKFQFVSSVNNNDDGSKSNHVVKWGFNIFNQNPNNARLWRSMESNWFSGGLRYLEDILEVQLKNGTTSRLAMHTFRGGDSYATSDNQIDFRGTSINLKSLDDLTDRWSVGPGQMQLFSSGVGYSQFQMMNGATIAQFANNGTDMEFSGMPFRVSGNLALQTSILGSTDRAAVRLFDNVGNAGFLINHGTAYPNTILRKAVVLTSSNGNAYQGALALFNDNKIFLGDLDAYTASADKINFGGVTHFLDNMKVDSMAVGTTADSVVVWDAATKEFKVVPHILPLGLADQTLTASRNIFGGETKDLNLVSIRNFDVQAFTTSISGRLTIQNELEESIIEDATSTLNFTTSPNYVFTGTTGTWTLPDLSLSNKRVYHVKNAGSGNLTIDTAGGNIYNSASVTTFTLLPSESRTFKAGASFWYVFN